jgi:hypothetical protein
MNGILFGVHFNDITELCLGFKIQESITEDGDDITQLEIGFLIISFVFTFVHAQ